jgi:type IV pilus assembly protein PilB
MEISSCNSIPRNTADVDFFHGEGCDRCGSTGFRGRTAIHEVFVIDSELRRRIIRSEASSRLKRYALTRGMHTLRMDGWEKILMGQTTIQEIYKLVGQEL